MLPRRSKLKTRAWIPRQRPSIIFPLTHPSTTLMREGKWSPLQHYSVEIRKKNQLFLWKKGPKKDCGPAWKSLSSSKTRKINVERALRRCSFPGQLQFSGIMNGSCLLFLCLLFAKKSTRSIWILEDMHQESQLFILRLLLTGWVTLEKSLACSEH